MDGLANSSSSISVCLGVGGAEKWEGITRMRAGKGLPFFTFFSDMRGREEVDRRRLTKSLSSLEFKTVIRESLVHSSVILHPFIQ